MAKQLSSGEWMAEKVTSTGTKWKLCKNEKEAKEYEADGA